MRIVTALGKQPPVLVGQQKHAILAMVMTYFSALISFAATLLIAREIGAEAFGMMTFAFAVGAFLSPAINLGTDRVFVATFLRLMSESERQALIGNNLIVKLRMSALIAIGTIAGILVYAESSRFLGYITLIMWVSLLGAYPMVWFDAIGKTATQNILNFWERVAIFVFALTLMVTPERWVSTAWVGSGLLLIRCFSLGQQHKVWGKMTGLKVWPVSQRRTVLKNQGFSLSVTASALLSVTVLYFSQLILSREVSAYEFAAYGVAFLFVNMVILFQSQLLRLLLRSITQDWENVTTLKEKVYKNCAWSLFASTILAGVAWLGMHLLPWILDDVRYATISHYSFYLCAWTMVMGINQIVTQYAITGGQQKKYFIVTLVGAVVTVVTGVWWIPDGGVRAASVILLLVQIGMGVAAALILRAAILRQQTLLGSKS